MSCNQEMSSSEQSSDEDDKENKSVRTESIQQQGASQNVKRIEVNANVFQQSLWLNFVAKMRKFLE